MKLISTMKLRLKYNKIAYLCRKHNRQGADRIIRESTYGVRIIGDSPSGMDSASSMEDALFFFATLTITKKCGKTQKLGVKKEILHSSDDHRLYSRF